MDSVARSPGLQTNAQVLLTLTDQHLLCQFEVSLILIKDQDPAGLLRSLCEFLRDTKIKLLKMFPLFLTGFLPVPVSIVYLMMRLQIKHKILFLSEKSFESRLYLKGKS